jgi:hypothetical protein
MSLFMSMLPIYVLGNLHCIGMCGPLVMMIGHHRYRYWYFLGRTLSFALAGMLAGGLGSILTVTLSEWYIPALISITFGLLILSVGLYSLSGIQYPGYQWLGKTLAGISKGLSLLLLKDEPYPAFLFGLGTVLLPCGQTVVVFSACAIFGDPLIGFLNGMAFALITSPSLWVAMHAKQWLKQTRASYNQLFGSAALLVGVIALCRGLADLSLIPHLILSTRWHIVIF